MNVPIRSHFISKKNLSQPSQKKSQHTAAYGVVAQNMQNLAEVHVSLYGMAHYWGINMGLENPHFKLQIPRLMTAGYLLTRTRDLSQ